MSTVFYEIYESLRFKFTDNFVHSLFYPMAISFVEINWGFNDFSLDYDEVLCDRTAVDGLGTWRPLLYDLEKVLPVSLSILSGLRLLLLIIY